MYRSPPSPLVMIAGEVEAAVSSTVMSLQHLTSHVSHQPSVSARLGGRRATDRSVLYSLYTPLYSSTVQSRRLTPRSLSNCMRACVGCLISNTIHIHTEVYPKYSAESKL